MLNFEAVKPEDKQLYEPYLRYCAERGCEYSFANMYLWGRHNGEWRCEHAGISVNYWCVEARVCELAVLITVARCRSTGHSP